MRKTRIYRFGRLLVIDMGYKCDDCYGIEETTGVAQDCGIEVIEYPDSHTCKAAFLTMQSFHFYRSVMTDLSCEAM